jgi:alpha-tubulin suppressor-like RCC1 family protein
MDFLAAPRTGGSRHGLALTLAAIVAALSMATASAAQATPNVAKAWGRGSEGELGNGTNTASSSTPVNVSNLSGVTAIYAGGNNGGIAGTSVLALLESETAKGWGRNDEGPLGIGTHESSNVPVAVCAASAPEQKTGGCPTGPFLEGVRGVSVGTRSGLDLLSTGKVVATSEFLGNGTTETSDVPVEVPGLEHVKAVVTGDDTVHLALLENGKVMAWGGSQYLGNGTLKGSTVPVAVCAVGTVGECPTGPYLEGVKAVSINYGGVRLALLESGEVVAWGANERGELGNGTTVASDVPVKVTGLSKVTAISAGQAFDLARLSDGKVMAWGANDVGQLGTGSSTGPEECGKLLEEHPCAKKPVTVTALSGVTAISAGAEFSLALLSSGRVMAWGANTSGDLGDGESEPYGPEHCGHFLSACATTPLETKVLGAKGIAAGVATGFAFGPPPVVTAVKPKQGPVNGGTTVEITGTHFAGATAVKFGSTSAASFNVNTATSITAVSPAEPAGIVDVTVTNEWGTSPISLADRFKFAPTVSNVSPNTGSTAGGTTVTVTGTGFVAGTTATKFKFGLRKGTSVSCASTTTCKVVSPAHAAGTVDVKATVNKVSSAKSAPADQYTYA